MSFDETPRERAQRLGRCTGPHDGAPAPGEVGLDKRAPCCTCGRRVIITIRGRYAHHKRPAGESPQRTPTGSSSTVNPVLCRQLADWASSIASAPGGGDAEHLRPKLRDVASQLTAAADLGEIDLLRAVTDDGRMRRGERMNSYEQSAWRVLLGLGARLTELAGKPTLDLRPIRVTSEKKLRLFLQASLGVAGRSGCNRRHVDRAGVPVYVVTDDSDAPRRP